VTSRFTCCVAVAVVLLVTAAQGKAADHLVGLGLGGGVRVSSHDLRTVSPELGLPALEIGPLLANDVSIDVSIPVGRMIASAVLVQRLWIGFDAYPTFRAPMGERTRFVAAPGVGWMASAGGGNGTVGVRAGGRLGVELLSPQGGFALGLLLQPGALVEFGDVGVAVSGGLMTWVRWTWLRR